MQSFDYIKKNLDELSRDTQFSLSHTYYNIDQVCISILGKRKSEQAKYKRHSRWFRDPIHTRVSQSSQSKLALHYLSY